MYHAYRCNPLYRLLWTEFDRLRRMSVGGSVSDARSDANVRLNRYCNVLPYNANRVRLAGGPSDYINASLLESPPEEQPPWRYIATQVGYLSAVCCLCTSSMIRHCLDIGSAFYPPQ